MQQPTIGLIDNEFQMIFLIIIYFLMHKEIQFFKNWGYKWMNLKL